MEFVRMAVFVIFFSSFASGLTCYKYSATFEISSQKWKTVAKPAMEHCKKEAVGCQLIMTPRTDGNKNLIGVSSYGACAAKPNDSSLGCEMEDLFIEQAGVQTGNCICTQDNCNLALALKWYDNIEEGRLCGPIATLQSFKLQYIVPLQFKGSWTRDWST